MSGTEIEAGATVDSLLTEHCQMFATDLRAFINAEVAKIPLTNLDLIAVISAVAGAIAGVVRDDQEAFVRRAATEQFESGFQQGRGATGGRIDVRS